MSMSIKKGIYQNTVWKLEANNWQQSFIVGNISARADEEEKTIFVV